MGSGHVIRGDSIFAVSSRGRMIQRRREMNGVLPKAVGEIRRVLHVDGDEEREESVQAMGEILVDNVVGRRALGLANRPPGT